LCSDTILATMAQILLQTRSLASVWYVLTDKYRGISLQRKLVGTIESYIRAHPKMGYKS
jgi:hypothetical protein